MSDLVVAVVAGFLGIVAASFGALAYGRRTRARGLGGFLLTLVIAYLIGVAGAVIAMLGLRAMKFGHPVGENASWMALMPVVGFPIYVLLIYAARRR